MARKQNRRRLATHDAGCRPNASAVGMRDRSAQSADGFWTTQRLRCLAVCGLLALAVALTFSQTAGFLFVNLDDGDYVFGNPKVSDGLTWDGIRWASTKSHMENWHPLTWMSLMLDCDLYGLHPAGHHLTNVLLYAATVVALFLVLRAMAGRFWPRRAGGGAVCGPPLAGRVGGLGDREKGHAVRAVLCADAGGVPVLCAISGPEKGTVPIPAGALLRYAAVMAFLALGLLSKATLVTVPFLLLLLDYWPLGRLTSREGNGDEGGRGGTVP